MSLENQEVKEKAEFNMAVSYLNRLNSLFYAADEASINLDVYGWFHALVVIFREISTEMTQEQLDKKNTEIWELNNLVAKHTQNLQRTQKNQVDPALYKRLHDFELGLRIVMKDSGLQMKTQSDASKALFES